MTTPRHRTTKLIVPLTGQTVGQMRQDMDRAKAIGADMVECRLDYLAKPPTQEDLRQLLIDAPLAVIATNRPAHEGGRWNGDEASRLAVLAQAAELGADYVDIEVGVPRAQWPHGQIIHSHHDFKETPKDILQIAASLDATGAAVSKLAFLAENPADALLAMDILRICRKPTLALAMGEAGVCSRILARKFGAMGTFATLSNDQQSAPGQPTLSDLKELYRWDAIGAHTAVYGVIGCPVAHSMSPAIHNAAFAAAGLDAVYVPLRIEPGQDAFNTFLDALRQRPWLDWRGLSVTIPHKEHALAYIGQASCEDLAVQIGAVNTITLEPDGSLRGKNTDYSAAIDALCQAMRIDRTDLAGRACGVLGAGGAARAIVAALAHYEAKVTVYNRTPERAQLLAEEFGGRWAPLDAAPSAPNEILINCTPLGMSPQVEQSPLESIPPATRVVFDTIYNPLETRLLRQARSAGCLTVSGLDMFVNQAAAQFEIWTGRAAPRKVMRNVVVKRLGGRDTP